MPVTGAAQVTLAEPSCLQLEGGSWPFASALLFASMSAFISALVVCVGFGLADMDGMVILPLACEPEPLSPAQMPSPAATRTRATRAASQRGRRYQRGPRGRPGGG